MEEMSGMNVWAIDMFFFFFFFQAEDGIRDRNVTGVQTCALPILRSAELGERFVDARPVGRRERPGEERRAREDTDARVARHVKRARRILPREDVEIGRASCRERVERWVGAE